MKELKFRLSQRSDIGEIDRIWREGNYNFSLPNTDQTLLDGVAFDENGIVGFGLIKLYPEGIMVIDQKRPLRDKALAVKLLLHIQHEAVKRAGFDKVHVFTQDTSFHDILRKHYGYHDIVGDHLARNLRGSLTRK